MRPEPFEIERYFARFEFSARHLLSSSDCEPLGLGELLAMADAETLDMWDRLSLAYTESAGLPALREEVAHLYEGVHADEVLEVVPEEGILLAMWALLEPGDHVVVTWPAYQSLHAIAEAIGCDVGHWEPHEDEGFRLEDLRAAMRPSTRLVVVNFPHNPTGEMVSREDFGGIAGIAAEAGAYLFSDEMYRMLEQDPADRLPSAVTFGTRTIALSGMSKALSLPGLRVGWLVTHDEALLERIASLKDYTTICASAPSEVLALAGLRARDRIVARNLGIIRAGLDAIDAFVEASDGSFVWRRPKAGSVGLARWDAPGGTAAVCERLGAEGIMLLPSRVFGYGDRHVRFGFGRAAFPRSLDALAEWIARHTAVRRDR